MGIPREIERDIVAKPEQKLELEIYLLAREIADLKVRIKKTLQQYNVSNLDALEKKIEEGSVPEHPTYENYLSALPFQLDMEELSATLISKIQELTKL
ncbi:MAG: hypothetical protein ACE5R6_20645 [Candidatus Heimdallarchaeota archaeon]